MHPDECDKACGDYQEPMDTGSGPPLGKLINITDYIPDRSDTDGKWWVFKDPYLCSVHVINTDGIEDIMWGAVDLDNADRQCVARAIIRDWLEIKGIESV